MVPNADRDKETSIPINQATFLMTNMVAQAPGNNQGPWADLENYLRTLLPADEIYIVAGGAGEGGTGSSGGLTTTLAGGNISVPAYTWKAALVIPKGGDDDVSRVTCSSRTIAVIMPNTDSIRNDDWQKYLTTVDAVETLTGYNLFSSLPDAVERCVEASVNGTYEPVFSPLDALTIEAGSASVTITGTLGVAGLVPPGVVAVSLDGMAVSSPIEAGGRFTATFPANSLTVANSPYTIGFSYAGDGNFKSATASSSLHVIDTTAPLISTVTATPNTLRPPNHKMIDVTLAYTATDFSGVPSCSVTVSSNEPIDGLGDGNTSVDWRVIDARQVQLRAERSGQGEGRLYAITVSCGDASGNASTATTQVSVPK
jgi:hypothetical protein